MFSQIDSCRRVHKCLEQFLNLGTFRAVVTGILVMKKMVLPRSQAVRIRIRVRLGSGDDNYVNE